MFTLIYIHVYIDQRPTLTLQGNTAESRNARRRSPRRGPTRCACGRPTLPRTTKTSRTRTGLARTVSAGARPPTPKATTPGAWVRWVLSQFDLSICIYIHMYVYMHVCLYVCILYIYIYIYICGRPPRRIWALAWCADLHSLRGPRPPPAAPGPLTASTEGIPEIWFREPFPRWGVLRFRVRVRLTYG